MVIVYKGFLDDWRVSVYYVVFSSILVALFRFGITAPGIVADGTPTTVISEEAKAKRAARSVSSVLSSLI